MATDRRKILLQQRQEIAVEESIGDVISGLRRSLWQHISLFPHLFASTENPQ
jgi:hypothetical protein